MDTEGSSIVCWEAPGEVVLVDVVVVVLVHGGRVGLLVLMLLMLLLLLLLLLTVEVAAVRQRREGGWGRVKIVLPYVRRWGGAYAHAVVWGYGRYGRIAFFALEDIVVVVRYCL